MVFVSQDLTQSLLLACRIDIYLTLLAVASLNHLKVRIIPVKRIMFSPIFHEIYVGHSLMNVVLAKLNKLRLNRSEMIPNNSIT